MRNIFHLLEENSNVLETVSVVTIATTSKPVSESNIQGTET